MAGADRLKLASPHQVAKPEHYMRELRASAIEQVSGGWKGGGSAFQDGEPYIAANVYGA